MDLSDCQSSSEDDGSDIHSDESSGMYPEPDAVMEEVQEGSSPMKVDNDQAVDLMRFAFREGMAFLDNGSGRSFEERMLLDMSDFMVNLLLGGPQVSWRDGPRRMWEITPTLDKDIARAFTKETRKGVASEIHRDLFGIVVDLCSPPRLFKHYMVLFARYLNCKGEVMERLVGIVPEPEVYDSALNVTVHSMLSEAGLSLLNVRGQGYGLPLYTDEVFTDLKASVTKATASAYYVHPNAFHLNSTLAYASQKQVEVFELFQAVDYFSDLVQGSPEFREKLRFLMEERGLNLESDLEKPGETCWGSYYKALEKLAAYLPHVCDVLGFMERHASKNDERNMALKVQRAITEEFPFVLLLMRDVLGATIELSLALDRRDLDIENYMRSDARFSEMNALSDLSVKMVETGKNAIYPLVYLLLKLALILPGTAATAKTASSTMKFVDSTMIKEPCNQWTSDCLLMYLERDVFESITNDAVIASL
ncbi:hypothetical protein QOZ80_3BG0279290 [Eleusine coracana subsp. coracana]|nr:hypothetical protein QOZ80_3BG0279290 [Eleusine coracana subsp. coracana]